ncbi:TMEM165/GDT1 family protein [Marinospirillum alkaliphilum]|uniref:GDT1 family protein n=1 Tax=Marinospirillum alkaliphilum DSM 21637 TaxID=1122209 RepID=A0A1K1XQ42_9GAMM|nr:TMEM165/GDT1 family protein [Marinospirillum alkaliphilum]SFX51180.1 Putative Ca2+/H+ antiporter, TMEM165/GDT1 family [Marinospirillum alkaliphilum DSM 21637]
MEFLQNLIVAAEATGAGAFLISTLIVTLAEIGDKTQLLALVLIARYRQPWPIIWGILLATLLNHALAAWLGALAAQWLASDWLPWILGISFILMGIWVLIPDKLDDEDTDPRWMKKGAFIATLVLFFMAEMGDKTQVATVALGAHFDSLVGVILGTTLGMLLANVPVILAGHLVMDRLPIKAIHGVTALLFILLGVWTLWY